MAAHERNPTAALMNRLADAPWEFDFFGAVRTIAAAHADRPRPGWSKALAGDPIRFGQTPSLAFAPSTLQKFAPAGPSGGVGKLSVHFLGLLGPNGPMPLHFTEYVLERLRERDPSLRDFLDVFHHRILSLFYRAWAYSRPAASQDRPDDDYFAQFFLSLIGLGMPSLQHRDEVTDLAKIHFAGRVGTLARNAEGLRSVLNGYFNVRFEIHEFHPRWVKIPDRFLCRLGENPENATMGTGLVTGDRVWTCDAGFRLITEPLSYADYQRFLPGVHSLERVTAWVHMYVGEEQDCDLQLRLKASETPPLIMGAGGRLGWSTWLTSQQPEKDADDLVLHVTHPVAA